MRLFLEDLLEAQFLYESVVGSFAIQLQIIEQFPALSDHNEKSAA